MKKPDKIKRALLLHASPDVHCSDCAYFGDGKEGLKCEDAMCYDALEYIQTLEKKIAEYELPDKMRSNREHAFGWIEFWRNKHGKSTLDIPDGDEIFKDWEEAHALAESRLRRMKLFKRREEEHLAECVQLRNKVKQLEKQIANTGKIDGSQNRSPKNVAEVILE